MQRHKHIEKFVNKIFRASVKSQKKVKFHRILRDKFEEKTADFMGNSEIFGTNFAEK